MMNNSNKYIQIFGGFTAVVFGVLQGIDWLFKKYAIDNFYFNIILGILFFGLITSLIVFFTKKNKQKVHLTIPPKKEFSLHLLQYHYCHFFSCCFLRKSTLMKILQTKLFLS